MHQLCKRQWVRRCPTATAHTLQKREERVTNVGDKQKDRRYQQINEIISAHVISQT